MPTYVYQAADPRKSCDRCRGGFEVRQPMKEKPLRECPECRSPVMRVIQPAGINTRGRSVADKDKLLKLGFKTGSQLLEEGKFKE